MTDKIVRRIVAAGIVFGVLGATAEPLRRPAAAGFEVRLAGELQSRALHEVSGMAASRRRDDLLWMHNDSGSGAYLYAVDRSGRALGRLRVLHATAHDWEDMASFDYHGRPMLLIADVGDNYGQRSYVWLHFLEEPVVPEGGLARDASAEVAWSVPFRYPEGAADCEAVAVDVKNDRVLLLSKRQRPPRLYGVAIRPDRASPSSGRLVEATFLGTVTNLPGPSAEDILKDPIRSAYRSQPTAMDLSANQLLVLTYGDAYLFVRPPGSTWPEAVAGKPDIIRLPMMRQSEALAFDRLGEDAYVTSEKRPAPLYRLQRETTAKSEP